MCGRFTLTASPEEIAETFALDALEAFPPRYNIAPTQPVLLVIGGTEARPDANRAGRAAMLARWGLVPTWVKDLKGFPLLFNARSETAAEKASFRSAMKYRRCLLPASGFYEWRRTPNGKTGQAYFLKPRSGRPIAFAGLFETWHATDGSEIDTAAILTTSANAVLSPIHERMPVVVPEGAFERWLDCRSFSPAEVADLLVPAAADAFEAIPVSDRVNAVANTHPDIQAAIEVVPDAPAALAEARPPEDKGRKDEGPAQPSLF